MESTSELELDVHEGSDDMAEAGSAGSTTEPKHKTKEKIEFESVVQLSEAVAYFAALVDGLKHGQLQFRRGDEQLSLTPTERVSVEVKATRKGNREKVSLELEWMRVGDDSVRLSG
jgi:amphi-Trp domain-containing protein